MMRASYSSFASGFILFVVNFVDCGYGNSSADDDLDKQRSSNKVFTGDYCAFEYFNATCRAPDELLLIRSARYGRMQLGGRCVRVDLGYVGCAVDVSHVISSRCTARKHCSVAVGDSELRMRKPCPTDVTWYLEVSYSCIKALTREQSACNRRDPVHVTHPGYLASSSHVSTDPNDCSTTWSLKPSPWQRMRISLVGLYGYNRQHRCAVLGSVSEVSSGRRTVLNSCRSDGTRVAVSDDQQSGLLADSLSGYPLYTSNSSDILTLTLTIPFDHSAFLLRYDVLGCPIYTAAPVGSTIRRISYDRLVVHCNITSLTSTPPWTVACRAGVWVPSVSAATECPLPVTASGYENFTSTSLAEERPVVWQEFFTNDSESPPVPLSILLAVAVGVSMGIFLGGVLLAVVWPRISRRLKISTGSDTASNEINSPSTTAVTSRPVTDLRGYISGRPCYYVSNPVGVTTSYHSCGFLHPLPPAPSTAFATFPLTVLPADVTSSVRRSSSIDDGDDDEDVESEATPATSNGLDGGNVT